MKKRIIPTIACSLVAILGLSGCSCANDAILNFNNAVHAGNNPSAYYSEQAVYEVSSTNDGKTANVDSKLSVTFSGEYETGFWVYESLPTEYSEYASDNELIKENDFDFIYVMTSKLSVEAAYSYEGKDDQVKNDSIETLTLFTSSNNAYAPIYSNTNANYSILGVQNGELLFKQVNFYHQTIYGEKQYTVKRLSQIGTEYENEQTKSYDYTFKSLIDNNQLFFAIRNTTLEDEKSTYFPVVAPQYGEKSNLRVTREKTTTNTIESIIVNGEEVKNEDVKLAEITYINSTSNKSGSPQKIFIQAEKSSNGKIEGRAIVFKHFSPIYEHGNNGIIGTLVYQLKEISYR